MMVYHSKSYRLHIILEEINILIKNKREFQKKKKRERDNNRSNIQGL